MAPAVTTFGFNFPLPCHAVTLSRCHETGATLGPGTRCRQTWSGHISDLGGTLQHYQPHPPARDGRNGSAREQGGSTTPPPAAFRHFSKLIGPAWRGEAARRTGTGGGQETLHLSLTAGPAVE